MRWIVICLLGLFLISLPFATTAQEVRIIDATGTEVELTGAYTIVSGSGDITEIIYALGHEDRLLGVDATATYPPQALETLPSIGFARQLNVEAIAALNPDIFLCTQTCSPDTVFEQLRALGIAVVIIPDSETADLTLPRQKITMVAQVLLDAVNGELLAQRVEREMDWVQTAVANSSQTPAIFSFYIRGRGLQLAAGEGTPADAMIRGAGGINASTEAGVVGYQALSPEIILTAYPDWILLTSGNVEASGGLEEILKIQGLNATPAVDNEQVVVMDTAYLLAMSTRTGQALMELAGYFHPEMTWERMVSYPYTYTDITGTAVTVEAEPQMVIASNPELLELTRQLGFHSEMADALPEGSLIIAAETDEWAGLRASGGQVLVVSENASIEEVAAALNVVGRGQALQARLNP